MARCSQASSDAAVVSSYRSAFSSASWALSFVCSRNVSSEAAAAPPSNRSFAQFPELSLASSKLRNQNVQPHHHQKCMSQSFSGLELGSFQERFVGFRSLVVFAKQTISQSCSALGLVCSRNASSEPTTATSLPSCPWRLSANASNSSAISQNGHL